MTNRLTLPVLLGAGVVAALALRPMAHGVPGATALVFWATLLGQVVVPGVLLCRGARMCAPGDNWLLLGQGSTLGLAIQGLAFLGGRAVGMHWLPTLAALAAAATGLALARRTPRPSAENPPPARSLTLAVALAAVLLQPLASTGHLGKPVPFDMLFHAGTAGELRHRWPLEDPRVAGVPMHYHVLSYALPVEAADRADAPVADPLFGLVPLFWVALLALQVSNAGRRLFRDGRAGALGAAVLMLHTDPGRFLGLAPGAFNSYLATGIFGSPTTVCGLVLLAGLIVALEAWIEGDGIQNLAAVALLAAAASGAKTTVLPVVLGGIALAGGLKILSREVTGRRRWLQALAVAAVAGAPLTAWQTMGEATYSAMAGLGPGEVFTRSAFASVATRALTGTFGALATVVAFVAWIVGYLGLGGLAAASWLLRGRERWRPIHAFALGTFGVGLGASLLLGAPGLSQLFLLYNGQLLLCLFAGAGLAQAWKRPRGTGEAAIAIAIAVAALPVADHVMRAIPAGLRADLDATTHRSTPLLRDYSEGLAWLRAHATANAVVFADNPSLILSAFGEVRLYYENGQYTTRASTGSPVGDAWPERSALQERLLRRPDREAVEHARRAVGNARRLLVVADNVPSRIDSGFVFAAPAPVPSRRFFPEALFDRLFVNGAMQIYEVREGAVR